MNSIFNADWKAFENHNVTEVELNSTKVPQKLRLVSAFDV